ncbi:MAG: hypothetical protein ABI675_08320 [Chitinophagaceae bacterium]
MDKIQEHLSMIYKTSLLAEEHFVNKHQDELARFVFCGVQKVSRICLSFLRLYPQLASTNDLEFSLGILARSVLMDMILVLKIKNICINHPNNSLEELKVEVKEFCYAVIADGTNHIIDEIFSSKKLSDEEKKKQSLKLASLFSKAFDLSVGRPKLKNQYKYRLGSLGKESQHPTLVTGESVMNLYSYYSKYDHLSHWTSLSSTHLPFENRKDKLDLSIILMVIHLRDLLSIAHDFDENYKILLPFMNDLQNYLDESYRKELESNEQANHE